MAYSYITRLGDGGTSTFSISFTLGFLERTDVTARVGDEVDGLDLPLYRTITWLNDGLVTISGLAPGVDVPVVFKRTVSKSVLKHDYSDGAVIEEKNLDESNLQLMMAIHELLDGRIDAAGFIIDEGAFATGAQLTALEAAMQAQIDDLQAQIDALTAALAGVEAAAVAAALAAVATAIDAAIAAALAGLEIVSGGGVIIDHVYDDNTAHTSISTLIPTDDTIPQVSEGTEILSVVITPKNNTNKLKIFAHINGSVTSGYPTTSAVFVNGGANAIDATVSYNYDHIPNSCPRANMQNYVEYTPGTTAPQTISVRVGQGTGGTLTLNSSYGAISVFGGVSRCVLVVEEVTDNAGGELGDFVKWSD